ncbi:hypothetical protein GPECTOR_195g332 [Gonium pectorale]|uniref:Uncharacterized protein n=1 Tax=Gonium pectorale TaxID=33097 RepID=A0A150FX14_GONPE|nr:hypothetical protein GPECTOR_195g332 [Gonium pectorale]|eukprot:KXZ42152.1 hypothetical protein GPECTOR_195g332 [Gonium pectorale]
MRKIQAAQHQQAQAKYGTTASGCVRHFEYDPAQFADTGNGEKAQTAPSRLRALLAEHSALLAFDRLGSDFCLGVHMDFTSQVVKPLQPGDERPYLLLASVPVSLQPRMRPPALANTAASPGPAVEEEGVEAGGEEWDDAAPVDDGVAAADDGLDDDADEDGPPAFAFAPLDEVQALEDQIQANEEAEASSSYFVPGVDAKVPFAGLPKNDKFYIRVRRLQQQPTPGECILHVKYMPVGETGNSILKELVLGGRAVSIQRFALTLGPNDSRLLEQAKEHAGGAMSPSATGAVARQEGKFVRKSQGVNLIND